MKIINRRTKVEEKVKVIYEPNGKLFISENETIDLFDDSLIGFCGGNVLDGNFYKIKELKEIIKQAEEELETNTKKPL